MKLLKIADIQPRICFKGAYGFMQNAETTHGLLKRAGEAGYDIVTSCKDIDVVSHLATNPEAYMCFYKLVDISHPVIENILADMA